MIIYRRIAVKSCDLCNSLKVRMRCVNAIIVQTVSLSHVFFYSWRGESRFVLLFLFFSYFLFGANGISLISSVDVLEWGGKTVSQSRELQRETEGREGEKSTSSQSHVTAEFPWRQQQCSTLRCSPAQLRAGIRHLATAAVGCILSARQVLSLLSEVSVMPLLSGAPHLQGEG